MLTWPQNAENPFSKEELNFNNFHEEDALRTPWELEGLASSKSTKNTCLHS